MKATLCQGNSTDFNGFLLDASVDLFLIDMGGRAKIRCSVSNCCSHFDLVYALYFQDSLSSIYTWSKLAVKVTGKRRTIS